jgi:hypothetical protein
MLFSKLLASDADRQSWQKNCQALSLFVTDCVACVVTAFDCAQEAASKTKRNHHIAPILLTRHVIESLDGVSVLIAQGCSHPCQAPLRSALEATLGVVYILQTDTERRAYAYQVAHAHRRIKLYEKGDPTTDAGREWRKVLSTDPCGDILSMLPPIDYKKAIANLQSMLAKPEFAPIEAEWQLLRAKKKKDPEWYALFGGPQNVRDLAIKVGHPAMYEFLYRQWSTDVHAGSALDAVGRKDGKTVIRPVRHPEILQTCAVLAATFSLLLTRAVLGFYAPEALPEFSTHYTDTIRQRQQELMTKQVFTAPWKDTLPR